MTTYGKVSISEVARLYGKDRKLVYNLIKENDIGIEKQQKPKRTLVQLTDIIQYWGEPENLVTPTITRKSMGKSREFTPNITSIFERQTKVLERENETLREDKKELKQQLREEREERREREKQLVKIIEQQHQLMLEDKREKILLQIIREKGTHHQPFFDVFTVN